MRNNRIKTNAIGTYICIRIYLSVTEIFIYDQPTDDGKYLNYEETNDNEKLLIFGS